MIVEDEQQQLRFRTRTANLFPYLKKLGSYLSPNFSFLQRNEYFKGVPIYIVQLTENPRSFWTERYFNVAGVLDNIHSRFIQSLDYTVGFGHNWIMQGSLMDAGNSDKSENYIFFDKEQAIKFSKTNGRKVARFSGGRTSSLENLVKKPKIFIYNLEDFLEDWEDKILDMYKGSHAMLAYMVALPLRGFSTRDKADEGEAFFKTHEVPEASMKLQQVLETIRSKASWLERDEEELKNFFTTTATK